MKAESFTKFYFVEDFGLNELAHHEGKKALRGTDAEEMVGFFKRRLFLSRNMWLTSLENKRNSLPWWLKKKKANIKHVLAILNFWSFLVKEDSAKYLCLM